MLIVNSVLNLRDSNFAFVGLSVLVLTVILRNGRLALSISCHHIIILDIKALIKQNVAVYFFDNVVFDKNKAINFNMNSKSICVKACRYFLVDLDKYVVCGLLDGAFTVFLRDRVNKF